MRFQLRSVVRVVFACFIFFSLLIVGFGYVKWSAIEGGADVVASGAESVAPANGTTVITTSMKGDNRLVAYAPNGSVMYYNETYFVYDDVDPSPHGEYTVTYMATKQLDRSECDASEACSLNVIERLNLTTGETERLYSRVTAQSENHWHDADRIGPHRWIVADIAHDRVFIINTTTGIETWSWSAQEAYPVASAGIFPGDWTHLNDVEQLPDGRIMVSLRNHDAVAFIHPQRGYQANWTLGSDENYSRLYEQHNPDYISSTRGGPAVLVADSENNRIVEYQRSNGDWRQTWVWNDTELRWPRDADRLPNGNTLITDTNGGRVIEVNERGEVVWEVHLKGPYEAERLRTGDESAGGPAATRADLQSRTVGASPEAREDPLWEEIMDKSVELWGQILPNALMNPILYVLPPWVGIVEFGGFLLLGMSSLSWGLTELYWSGYRLRMPLSK